MRISDWSSDVCSSDLAKYLLLDTEAGSALLHLGMSGSLRVLPASTPVTTHDHVDLLLEGGRGGARVLRFNDPRRFRSDGRRGGKAGVSKGRYRWSTYL